MPRVELRKFGDLGDHEDVISYVSWSPDGKYLASGSDDRTVRVWDVEEKVAVRVFRRHRDIVNCVAWSPDGRYLVSDSDDKTIRIWNWERGARRSKVIRVEDQPSRIVWSYDSRYFAVNIRDVQVYDMRKGRFVSSFRCRHGIMRYYFFWLPGSYRIVGQCNDRIVFWDALSGEVLDSFRLSDPLWGSKLSSLSPDGRYVTLKKYCDLYLFDLRDREVVWHFNSFRPEFAPREVEGEFELVGEFFSFDVVSVSWSPDGKFIAVSGADSSLRVLDASDGSVLFDTGPMCDAILKVSWSPSGKYIADYIPHPDSPFIILWEATII